MVESRLSKPLALAAIIVALALGVLLGMASGVVDRIFGGPDARTIATSSLESMRAQNRLITFVARYVSVVSSEEERLGGLVSTERTLILPGNVRYEVDLSKLQPDDVRWDGNSQTLSVRIPDVEIAGPEVDLGWFGAASVNYTGEYYSKNDVNNLPQFEVESFFLVNAKAGYEYDGVTISVFADNLLDEDYITGFATRNDPPIEASIGDGRTVGVEVRAKF